MAYCSKCGGQVSTEASFCGACGTAVLTSAQSETAQPTVQVNSLIDDEPSRIFVGKNYAYFQQKWQTAKGKNRKQSWNWAAFFGGIFWMSYRKMYLYSFGFIAAIMIEIYCEYAFGVSNSLSNAINFGITSMFGWYGNYWYKLHVEKKVREITSTHTPERAKIALVRQGGTSVVAGSLSIFALVAAIGLVIWVNSYAESSNNNSVSQEIPDSQVTPIQQDTEFSPSGQEQSDNDPNEVVQVTDEFRSTYIKLINKPEVIALRAAIDAYISGQESPFLEITAIEASESSGSISGLNAFAKEYYQGKFILLNEERHILGGVNLDIISQTNPKLILLAWMYQTADGVWMLRRIEESSLSKQDKNEFEKIKTYFKPFLTNQEYGF